MCRIRKYQFAVLSRKCPREEPEKPKVIAEGVARDVYLEIPTDLIVWRNPIRDINPEDVSNMAASFACHGQIMPIVVTGPDEEGKYEGVCGRLRYEAMKRFAGRAILARVRHFKDESERREWQLAENLHRRKLTEIQRDEATKELYELEKKKHSGVDDKHIVSAVATRIEGFTGEKPAERSVRQRLQIASELPKEVKNAVTGHREFGIRHAVELLRLKEVPQKQLDLAEAFAEKPMSVQKLKKRVDEVISPSPPKPEPVDTGLKFECPVCNETYVIIHVDKERHRFDRITVMDSEHSTHL